MSRSERAFNQVKSILGKLDRSIDEARARRMHPVEAPIQAPAPASAPSKPAAPASGTGSIYGRAKPLNPSGFQAPPRWES